MPPLAIDLSSIEGLTFPGKQMTEMKALALGPAVSPPPFVEKSPYAELHTPDKPFTPSAASTPQPATSLDDNPLTALINFGKQFITAGTLALGAVATPALAIDERPPISPVTAPSYDSHDHYEINIHPTPGMDAQAIARAVRAELARVDSEKSARKRSKLSDLE